MTLPFDMNLWTVFGFLGQGFFGSRFVVQWIASERKRQSYVPVVFWYLSLVGGIILTIYAIGRRDIVITAGQGLGVFIYLRNLVLIRRHRERLQAGQIDGTLSDRQCG